jgi:hypothetical protein
MFFPDCCINIAPPDRRLDKKHVRRRDLDHDLARAGERLGRLARNQHLRGAELGHHRRLHIRRSAAS